VDCSLRHRLGRPRSERGVQPSRRHAHRSRRSHQVVTLPDGSVLSNIADGGVGNRTTTATVAVDGAWLFPVTGVTAGVTTGPATALSPQGTPQGTKVYRTSGGTLTLTSTSNTLIGEVADGRIIGTTTPVRVGVGVA
jgi:hypothetical protein